MNGNSTRSTGNRGEEIARDYLQTKKYRIISTNYRTRLGEIDIIAESPKKILVFVEVKSLTVPARLTHSEARLFPEDHMTPHKYKKVSQVAEQFCLEHKLHDRDIRIDLVAVEIDPADPAGPGTRIRHFEGVGF
jgi:putative endonuclease